MPPSKNRIFFYKFSVFWITFFTYAAVHACRSVWSYSKDNLKNDPNYNFSSDFFGTCDLIFLLCYSASLYLFGWVGDRIDLRLYLAIGLIGTCTSFGTLGWMKFSNNYKNEALFAFFMGLNGVFQSVGWPGTIAIMGNWFGPEKRGLIMGIWSGNPNIGNIIGYEFGSITIDHMKLGYNYAIMCSIVFVLITLIILVIFVNPYPETLGIKIYDTKSSKANSINKSLDSSNDKPLGFMKALKIPGVPIYTLGYTCTKATSYGILFWLASYLKSKNMDDNASGISQVNDIGQFIGGLTLGFMNDRFHRKALFMPFFLVLAAVFFMLVRFEAGDSVTSYYVLMFFCGFFLGGPFNIISSAIAADLGKNPAIKGNKKALSTVSGIIEGSGSLGAAIIQKIIPYIENQIFVLLAILCFLGGLIVSPIAYKEYRRKRDKASGSFRSEEDHSLKKQLRQLDEGNSTSPAPGGTTLNLKG